MFESVIKPKQPKGKDWLKQPVPHQVAAEGFPSEAWLHEEAELFVISAVEVARDADNIDRGPEYHISISKYPKQRCTSQEAKWVLRQFNLEGAEEDNHVPFGIVRNFWRPVAEKLIGLECACKNEEPAIKEDKGDYIWRPAE